MVSMYKKALEMYKKAVVLDIVQVPNSASVIIMYYTMHECFKYLLLSIYAAMNVTFNENSTLLQLVNMPAYESLDADDKELFRNPALVLCTGLANPDSINCEVDLQIKNVLMCKLHLLFEANDSKFFNFNTDILLCGAIYNTNGFTYDCICINKEAII